MSACKRPDRMKLSGLRMLVLYKDLEKKSSLLALGPVLKFDLASSSCVPAVEDQVRQSCSASCNSRVML